MGIVRYGNLAKELGVASNTWKTDFCSCIVTLDFSFTIIKFQCFPDSLLSSHLIPQSSLWVPTQPRPSPGHTSLLTLENVCPVFWEPLRPYPPLTQQVPAWINLLPCPTCSFSSIPSFGNDTILHIVTKTRTWESFWAPPHQHSFLHPPITSHLFGPWNVFRTPCSLLPNNSLLKFTSDSLPLLLGNKTTSSYLASHPPISFQIDFSFATMVIFWKS